MALEPDNVMARDTFVSLLAEPPRVTPVEVEEELRALLAGSARRSTRNAVVGYSLMGAFIPLVVALGASRVDLMVVLTATWAAAMESPCSPTSVR